MKLTRRSLLAGTVGDLTVAARCSDRGGEGQAPDAGGRDPMAAAVAQAADEPVPQQDLFPEPVIPESMELLRRGEEITSAA